MARRKKYPKLPNGYGSIKYLGPKRRNPYAVHPPVTEFTRDGVPVTPKALCYVDDWMTGFAVLTAYRAGNYTPGMELSIAPEKPNVGANSAVVQLILADYNRTKSADEKLNTPKKTFSDVYTEFYNWKFVQNKSREYSRQTKDSTRAAFLNCETIHDRPFAELRHTDLQAVVDACPLKHASKELIVSLFHQMYKYADIHELVEKDYSAHVNVNAEEDDEPGVPFTMEDVQRLWRLQDDPVAEMLLIMCYSGFRISAYKKLVVNLDAGSFFGGVKTKTSKERTVPIHSGICPLVEHRLERYGKLLPVTPGAFRKKMAAFLESNDFPEHTPHDCRHTFSMLCEKAKVNDNDRKRMLGHSFGKDITNKVYGHRTLEDLKEEIEKIKICY